MDMERVLMVARWEGMWGNGCRGEGIKKYKLLQNSHGDVKYSIGSGVAKELIGMIHGHEQWWGDYLRKWKC